jgi:tetratricopeptide (TPR) repeat protein/S1-C subfamily serine protease
MTRLQNVRMHVGGMLVAALLAVGGNGVARAQAPAAAPTPAPRPVRGISRVVVQKPADLKPSRSTLAPASKTRFTNEQIADRLKYSTCFIVFIRKGKARSTGTGWIVDVKNRLVVTNHHVVDGNGPPDTLICLFPVKDKDGEWITDLNYYRTSVKPSRGTIITSTLQHDLALVQLDALPSGVQELPLAKKSARPGSQLHSLGGMPAGSQTMWIYSSGRVRQVGNRRNALGRLSRMVECQLAVNKGNSGGPIVNDFGELVAVVEGANFIENGFPVHNVTYHVDVKQLRSWLDGALPLVNPTTAAQYHDRGVRHLNASRTDAAMRDFSAAIRLDHKFAKSYAKRGWAFYRKGDQRTALADFDQAVLLDSTNADAYHGRGLANRDLKKLDAAIRDFSNAIRFEPENGVHYNQRGITTMQTRDVKSAYQDFVQATTLNGKEAAFFGNRGYAARLLGLYDDAVQSYGKALDLRGPNHVYYDGMGQALVGLKKYEAAQKAFLLAIQNYKAVTKADNWLYYRNLGVALQLAKDLKSAYAAFSKAIELNSKNAELYFRRGSVAKDFGRTDLANKDFQTAAQLDPKSYGSQTATTNATNTANGANATNATNATIPQMRTAEKPVDSDRRVVGMWLCVGNYKGIDKRIGAAFTKEGHFAMRFVSVINGREAGVNTLTGAYVARGGKVYITTRTGKVETYRYGFKNGQLWIEVRGTGVAMYFTRKS